MTKFLFKFKKTLFLAYFWSISPKKVPPPRNSGSVMHNSIRVSRTCQNSEKSNDPIPRKHPDRWQDGRMDRLYFTGSFQLPPGI